MYSDQPCHGAGKAIDVHVAPVTPDDAQTAKLQSEANMGRLMIGQTPRQVETAWGAPKRKNINTRKSGRTEQRVYQRQDGTTYVYIRDRSRRTVRGCSGGI